MLHRTIEFAVQCFYPKFCQRKNVQSVFWYYARRCCLCSAHACFPIVASLYFFFFYRYFFLVLVFRFLIIFQYSFYLPACIFKPFLPTFLLICIFTDTFIFFFSSFKSQETTILSFNIIDWSAIVSYVLKTNISRLSLLFFYLVPYSIDQRFEPHAASLQLLNNIRFERIFAVYRL